VVRHRLNRGGDRQLNRALHTIVMLRERYHEPTKRYVARRTAEGKSEREIRRCLKRTVGRQLYRLLERTCAEARWPKLPGGRERRHTMLVQHRTREPGMPGALGLRPGSGPKLLGVIAGVVLVLALVVTGRMLSGPGLRSLAQPTGTTTAPAPYRVGERFACPHTHPVLATSDGRSYPLGHPTPPPRHARAVGCYDTIAAAAAAGYAEAPLPAGALELEGVYLVPVPDRVRRECRQAAARLGFLVPCPTLRPVPLRGSPPPAVCQRPPPCGDPEFGFLFQDSGFVVPSGFVGNWREVGQRLVVAAARRPTAAAVACVGERPVAQARVRGHRGGLFQCPPDAGPHRDGLLVRWRERDTIMAVSITGHLAAHRRLVLALAAHLVLVPPSK
jgi:hypothetical protein